MPDMEKSISHRMNDIVEKRVANYINTGNITERMDEASNKFLRRCAVRNIEAHKVIRMLSLERTELRDILENIYCNTIYESFEIMDDNVTTTVLITEWIDAAIDIATLYQNYQGTPLILKAILEISAKQPYSDYKEFFEQIRETEAEISFEEILCKRNKYNMENNIKSVKEMQNMSAELIKAMRDVLPKGFLNQEMEIQKEILENDIEKLDSRREEVKSEIKSLEAALRAKQDELEAKKIEEAEKEKERRIDELEKENGQLRNMLGNSSSGTVNKQSTYDKTRNKKCSKKFAFTKKQKTQKLVEMMISKNYSPERIIIINNAMNSGADINELIKIVENDIDTGMLRETVKFLTNKEKSSKPS